MAPPFLLEQLSGSSSGWGRESCGSGKLGPLKEGEGMLLVFLPANISGAQLSRVSLVP